MQICTHISVYTYTDRYMCTYAYAYIYTCIPGSLTASGTVAATLRIREASVLCITEASWSVSGSRKDPPMQHEPW